MDDEYFVKFHICFVGIKSKYFQGQDITRVCKATITWCDLSPRFFCIDAMLLCEFESDKI